MSRPVVLLVIGAIVVTMGTILFFNSWYNSESWGCIIQDNGQTVCEGWELRFFLQNNLALFIISVSIIAAGIILLGLGVLFRPKKDINRR